MHAQTSSFDEEPVQHFTMTASPYSLCATVSFIRGVSNSLQSL